MCTCIPRPARSSSFRSPSAASTRPSFVSKLASDSTPPISAGSRSFRLFVREKRRKKSTDEVRTHVVLRTHRIRQITVQQLVFRFQTHRPVLVDVLAVAEADMSADQYIRVESVVLGVGEQRERIQGLCTLTRRRRGLLQGFGRSEEIERESQWLPVFAACP